MIIVNGCLSTMWSNKARTRGFWFWRKNWVLTLQPSEQKRNVSKRLLPQISQMWGTPLFPALGWGLSFRNITLALFITYVWTPLISNTFCTSETLTTSWYEDLLICQKKTQQGKKNNTLSKFGIFFASIAAENTMLKQIRWIRERGLDFLKNLDLPEWLGDLCV